MLTSLMISQGLSWIVIAALAVALIAIARQVGVLHMRVAPAGALTTAGGPAVGDKAIAVGATTLDGAPIVIGGATSSVGLRLLMFVSAQCPLCKGLIPVAKSFARDERVGLIFIGDDDPTAQHAMVQKYDLTSYPFVNGPEVGQAFEVGKLPYAVLLDGDGVVLSKGLVNSREHLESLIVAHEMGIRSGQDYITKLNAAAA